MTFNTLIGAAPDTQLSGCSSLQCADVPSKSCGSSGGFDGSNLTQLWAVYELSAAGADPRASDCCIIRCWTVSPLHSSLYMKLKPQHTHCTQTRWEGMSTWVALKTDRTGCFSTA